MNKTLETLNNQFKDLSKEFNRLRIEKERLPLKRLHDTEELKVVKFKGIKEKVLPSGLIRIKDVQIYTMQEIIINSVSRSYITRVIANVSHIHINEKTITFESTVGSSVVGFGYADKYQRRSGSSSYNISPLPTVLLYQYELLQIMLLFPTAVSIEQKLLHLEYSFITLGNLMTAVGTTSGLERLALSKLNVDLIAFCINMMENLKMSAFVQLHKKEQRLIKSSKRKKTKGFCCM